jgi:hypothetical protein
MFASLSLLGSTGFLSQDFVCSSQLCHLLGTCTVLSSFLPTTLILLDTGICFKICL